AAEEIHVSHLYAGSVRILLRVAHRILRITPKKSFEKHVYSSVKFAADRDVADLRTPPTEQNSLTH
ncbi:hypothetical protein, partial [Tardiphaga sp.]|uniref:hypothetical protein n=1 Tax=Tardiphaga sp. TaxID=1926292 RepID=UPI0037D9CDFB